MLWGAWPGAVGQAGHWGGWGVGGGLGFVLRSLNSLNSTRLCCLLSLGTLWPLVSQGTVSQCAVGTPSTLLPQVSSCSSVPWCDLVLGIP